MFSPLPSDYSDHPARNLHGFENRFRYFLATAADFTDPGLSRFDFTERTFLDDEMRTQYITYIYSCTVSSLLKEAQLIPVMTAGYSMGIYAALFDAGSVTFEAGLEMIRNAYLALRAIINATPFAMGSLIGLNENDIRQIIEKNTFNIEITNQNASHSFVVAGIRDDISNFLALALEEGALHIRDLSVTIPYHSSHLYEGALGFEDRISNLQIRNPGNAIISLVDQSILSTPDMIRHEVVRNLYHPLNWLRTMQVMMQNNISQWLECGSSRGLARNARFVGGVTFSPLPSMLT